MKIEAETTIKVTTTAQSLAKAKRAIRRHYTGQMGIEVDWSLDLEQEIIKMTTKVKR